MGKTTLRPLWRWWLWCAALSVGWWAQGRHARIDLIATRVMQWASLPEWFDDGSCGEATGPDPF